MHQRVSGENNSELQYCVWWYVCLRVYHCVCVLMCVCVRVYACVNECLCARACTCRRTCACVYLFACVRTRLHPCFWLLVISTWFSMAQRGEMKYCRFMFGFGKRYCQGTTLLLRRVASTTAASCRKCNRNIGHVILFESDTRLQTNTHATN